MLYSVLFGIYACFESELWIFPPEQIWMKKTWIQEELMHPSPRTRLVRRAGIKIKFHYVDAMGSEENTGASSGQIQQPRGLLLICWLLDTKNTVWELCIINIGFWCAY
jgi:hypothetical protein